MFETPQPLEDELSGEELRLLGSTLTVEVKPKTAPWAVYLGALGSDRSLDRWKEPHRNEANRGKSPKPAKRASSSALGHLLEDGFAHGRQLGQFYVCPCKGLCPGMSSRQTLTSGWGLNRGVPGPRLYQLPRKFAKSWVPSTAPRLRLRAKNGPTA